MYQFNPENERIKRKYFQWLTEAQKKSDATVIQIIRNINKFEKYSGYLDFKKFNKQVAINFKKQLIVSSSPKKGGPLSPSTILTTINNVKEFVSWLSWQPGYKSKINVTDIQYLNLSAKETRIGQTYSFIKYPSMEIINKVIDTMPYETVIEKRDRALIAFVFLTGIRDGAIGSLKLKNVHLDDELIDQDPRNVNTKFSKHIITYFFPVGENIKNIFVNWVNHLINGEMYDSSCPLFPRTHLINDENNSYKADGIEPTHWNSAQSIRKIFREAFLKAGFNYYSPHSLRHTLVNLGERLCKTPEEFKSWSQNLGHESPLTTFTSYGAVSPYRQGDIIRNLRIEKRDINKEIIDKMRQVLEEFDGNTLN